MKAILVIAITLTVVVLINLAIYYAVTRRNPYQQETEIMRRMAERIRAPWAPEDQQYQELSRLVDEMKEPPVSSAQDEHHG